MKKICILPGDGIGPEVVDCAVAVIGAASDGLEFVKADIGESAYRNKGSSLPNDTIRTMMACDSSLFGAATTVNHIGQPSPVLGFRRLLDLYANVRPVRTIVPSSARDPLDIVIVRENSEGMYTMNEVYDDEGVTTLRRVTKKACSRIVDYAIDHARSNGRSRICCVHKANVLKSSDGLFLEIFKERMSQRGNALSQDECLVDAAGMLLVTNPSRFDVIVTLNLYGDILSDVAAGVAGGLGFAPSGNIGPKYSVFEPAHGSAPDIAGKGVANPTAAILAGAMMLKHIGLRKEASMIEQAVGDTYASGHLTVDVGGRHGSKSFTEHILDRVAKIRQTG